MNPHMIEPRCLIAGVHIRRLFPDIFLGWGNGFVWTRDLFRRAETNETASRDRDWWSRARPVARHGDLAASAWPLKLGPFSPRYRSLRM
jgi:hypothetical protein